MPQRPPSSRAGLRAGRSTLVPWLVLGLAVADWAALKGGLLEHPPVILAALAALAMIALLARGALCALVVVRTRRAAAGAEMLVVLGVVLALAAGTANWLLGLQGFVVLSEGERVPLTGGSHLTELVQGPLARLEEMEVVLDLEEVELLPAGPAAARSFVPRSHLVVHRPSASPERLTVEPHRRATAGPLRFHQGAFGFAPRIVLVEGEETLFDRVVPFTTERRGGREGMRSVAFEGAFTLERESLRVDGRVDLSSLDAALRGHATLELAVRRGGETLGQGRLLPGHFAEIGSGYRVGFAGLRKWSEILLSRRDYGGLVLGGGGTALLGLLALPLARRWDR